MRRSDPYLAAFFGQGDGAKNVTPDNVLSNLALATRCVALRVDTVRNIERGVNCQRLPR